MEAPPPACFAGLCHKSIHDPFLLALTPFYSRLGKEAIAVIGLTESIMTLVYAVAIGISFAATAIVARRIGEKDPECAARAAGQILILGLTLATGLGAVLALQRTARNRISVRRRHRNAVLRSGSR